MEMIEINDRPASTGQIEKDEPDGWKYRSNSEFTEQEDIFSIIERMDGLYIEFETYINNFFKSFGCGMKFLFSSILVLISASCSSHRPIEEEIPINKGDNIIIDCVPYRVTNVINGDDFINMTDEEFFNPKGTE